jgi:hypothetical protein
MSCGRSIKLNTPLFQLRSSNTSSGAMPESGSYCLTFEPLTTRQLLFFPTMEAKQTGITIRIAYWYAVAQYLTRPNSVKEGAQRVLQWLAHDGLGLKKMTVCMKLGQSDTIQCATLEMGLETLPENVTIIPIQV